MSEDLKDVVGSSDRMS